MSNYKEREQSKFAQILADLYEHSFGKLLIWGGVLALLLPTATFILNQGAKVVLAYYGFRAAVKGT